LKEATLSNGQARRFMLLKHGLIGEYRFAGPRGILDFVRQAGCVQYDPIDVCGKNSELVFQSRVKGFAKRMLRDLLYKDRLLVDYFDKNLSVFLVEDWPYFARLRKRYTYAVRSREEVETVCNEIKALIRKRGPLSSADLNHDDYNRKVKWYWSATRLSRAALETMYFRGELVVFNKKGTVKIYDLAENHIPAELLGAPDPHPDDFDHLCWRIKRRIGAVGLLRNGPSDAFLGIDDLRAGERCEAFSALLRRGEIIPVRAEGFPNELYCLAEDGPLLDHIRSNPQLTPRCEIIAPLDNLLWDRKLIKALFGFDYKWEVYTPKTQRKYGYYVLPVVYGDRFAGRLEAVNDRKYKRLHVKNFWPEAGADRTNGLKEALFDCIERFAAFNECTESKIYADIFI
jgi:uncharacterized protein YcaQ